MLFTSIPISFLNCPALPLGPDILCSAAPPPPPPTTQISYGLHGSQTSDDPLVVSNQRLSTYTIYLLTPFALLCMALLWPYPRMQLFKTVGEGCSLHTTLMLEGGLCTPVNGAEGGKGPY